MAWLRPVSWRCIYETYSLTFYSRVYREQSFPRHKSDNKVKDTNKYICWMSWRLELPVWGGMGRQCHQLWLILSGLTRELVAMSVVERCLVIRVLSVGTVASSVVYESSGKMGRFDSEMILVHHPGFWPWSSLINWSSWLQMSRIGSRNDFNGSGLRW